jgi:hypothetical protein
VELLKFYVRAGVQVSNLVVMLLRLITSCEVQRREDFFFPFIMVRRHGHRMGMRMRTWI